MMCFLKPVTHQELKKQNQSRPTKHARHWWISDQSQLGWQNWCLLSWAFLRINTRKLMVVEGHQNFIKGWKESEPKLNKAYPETAGTKGVALGRNILDQYRKCCWTEEEKNCHFLKHLQMLIYLYWVYSAGPAPGSLPTFSHFSNCYFTHQITTGGGILPSSSRLQPRLPTGFSLGGFQ